MDLRSHQMFVTVTAPTSVVANLLSQSNQLRLLPSSTWQAAPKQSSVVLTLSKSKPAQRLLLTCAALKRLFPSVAVFLVPRQSLTPVARKSLPSTPLQKPNSLSVVSTTMTESGVSNMTATDTATSASLATSKSSSFLKWSLLAPAPSHSSSSASSSSSLFSPVVSGTFGINKVVKWLKLSLITL